MYCGAALLRYRIKSQSSQKQQKTETKRRGTGRKGQRLTVTSVCYGCNVHDSRTKAATQKPAMEAATRSILTSLSFKGSNSRVSLLAIAGLSYNGCTEKRTHKLLHDTKRWDGIGYEVCKEEDRALYQCPPQPDGNAEDKSHFRSIEERLVWEELCVEDFSGQIGCHHVGDYNVKSNKLHNESRLACASDINDKQFMGPCATQQRRSVVTSVLFKVVAHTALTTVRKPPGGRASGRNPYECTSFDPREPYARTVVIE